MTDIAEKLRRMIEDDDTIIKVRREDVRALVESHARAIKTALQFRTVCFIVCMALMIDGASMIYIGWIK